MNTISDKIASEVSINHAISIDVMSAIDHKYAAEIVTNPWIGHAITTERVCPDHVGHFRHYQGDVHHGNASIYWTPAKGAHLIYGLIRQKWSQLGWEKGPNGYPVTDEANAQSGHGRYNNFQNGTIIGKAGGTAAFAVYGAIYAKWGQDGWDKGELGFPQTDESGTPDGIGRYNHFDGGSIYWTPQTGAHIVKGTIRADWASHGWERGPLGYPLSDELVTEGTGGNGRTQHFQGGDVTWTPEGGAVFHLKPVICTIGLDNFSISNTRSRHEDTDFVSVSIAVGTRSPQTQTRPLGDLNNGTFDLKMYFQNVQIAPDESVVLTYNMVNAGHKDPGAVVQGLEKATDVLAGKAATAVASAAAGAAGAVLGASIGSAAVPLLGTALGALAGWLTSTAWGLAFADCDGPVASAVHVLTGAQIQAALANGHNLTQTDDHPGIDSAHGCGSNSHYSVTWSVK